MMHSTAAIIASRVTPLSVYMSKRRILDPPLHARNPGLSAGAQVAYPRIRTLAAQDVVSTREGIRFHDAPLGTVLVGSQANGSRARGEL